MTIAGMSIGSWILIVIIAVWTVIAIKIYFFGGFKKKSAGIGACCDHGDGEQGGGCAGCSGCDESATAKNAVVPKVRLDIK